MKKTLINKIVKRFISINLIPFLNSKKDEDRFPSGNAHMFQEDVSQHKMPYNDRLTRYPNFKIVIAGRDKDAGKEVLNNLSNNRHSYSDTDLVCDAVNNVSRIIYYFGKIYLSRRVESEGVVKFITIYPHNVFKIWKFYFQFIPLLDREKSFSLFRMEKDKNLFCLSPFITPFSRTKYRVIMKLLSFVNGVFPSFVMDDRFKNKNFEIQRYKQFEIRFMSLITRSYSWKLRFLADEYSNEYFKLYSSYLRAIYDAQDRELLIEQLNKMFHHFGIDASIAVEGIPTSHDLKNSLNQFKAGEKPFKQALDEIYLK